MLTLMPEHLAQTFETNTTMNHELESGSYMSSH